MNYKHLTLLKGKDKALERRHPWIFSGAFKDLPPGMEDGELAEVRDSKNNFKAVGFFSRGKIAVRVLSFQEPDNINDLIISQIQKAVDRRKSLGLLNQPHTNCLRLVFGEGDSLPGLVIDKYDRTAVIQVHHRGWPPFLNLIAEYLASSGVADHVYAKASEKVQNPPKQSGSIVGIDDNRIVLEHGHRFKIDWKSGQKTGFFIDQRENRKKLQAYAQGKKVLNTFSYTGGFSVYALTAGAEKAVSVDSSAAAIELANENAELNAVADRHSGITEDVFDHLKKEGDQYDIIILDPPAFCKSKKALHNALQAYKRLNLLALRKIRSGGTVFTFSCSQHMLPKLFEDTIRAAAIESGHDVKLVEKLGQPADHPINILHPEGEYLKGLILQVE